MTGNALLAAVRAELKAFKKEMTQVIKQEVKIQQQHAPARDDDERRARARQRGVPPPSLVPYQNPP